VIGMGEAIGIYAGMTWTRLKRGRLIKAAAALLALPVVIAIPLVATGQWGAGFFQSMLEVYLRFLIPFVPALLAAPVVAEEIDSRTFTFVFARPAPRPALVFGKLFATTLPVALATMISIALVWLLAMARFASDMPAAMPALLRAEAAALLGVLVFSSLAAVLGSLFTRYPFVGTAIYLLVIEAGLGSTPIFLHVLSASWHLRNLAGVFPPVEPGLFHFDVPAWASALVALVITLLGLGGAALAVNGAEYHGKD
jgi:ABC-type transport system involved in multi-copper enzyme maturation permease subunit